MPPEVTRFAGSSAALIKAVTGRLSARYVPVNIWMPRSLAAWASRRSSSPARPASRQPGGDRDGDVRGAVLADGLVAGDRDTALAGGFDGDEREPTRVVDGREVIEEFGRDLRVAAKVPAADGVGGGGLDGFGQRGRVTGQDGADQDAAPIAQHDQPLVLLRVAGWQIRGLPRRAHGRGDERPAPEVRHSARLPPPMPPAQSRRSLMRGLRGPPGRERLRRTGDEPPAPGPRQPRRGHRARGRDQTRRLIAGYSLPAASDADR